MPPPNICPMPQNPLPPTSVPVTPESIALVQKVMAEAPAPANQPANQPATPEPPPAPATADPPEPPPNPATSSVDLEGMVCGWIATNLSPDTVFSHDVLVAWARANGYYTKEEIVAAIVSSILPK